MNGHVDVRPQPRRWWLVALALLLGGPTPGAVGECKGDDGEELADLETYCVEREDLMCVRQAERGDLSEVATIECRQEGRAACDQRTWSPDCWPTKRQAEACLRALRSRDTLDTPDDEIEECSVDVLCRVRRTEAPDAGMEDEP
jgi:hypothetical protein